MKKVLIPTKLNAVAKELLMNHGNYHVVQDDNTSLIDLCLRNKVTLHTELCR